VQANVTPAPDAEPPPGSGQNTGVSGTKHAVAYDPGGYDAGGYDAGGYRSSADDPAAGRPRLGWRPRPIRYAHSAADETAAPTAPAETAPLEAADGSPPPPASPSTAIAEAAMTNTELPGTVLSGTVLPGRGPVPEEPDDYDSTGYDSTAHHNTDYDNTGGLIYEAPRPAYTEPLSAVPFDEPAEPAEPVANEGVGIFGDMATTEVPEDAPTRDFERPGRRTQPAEPPAPEPVRVIPVGAAWNQPITSPPVASEGAEERKPNPFGRMLGMRGGGAPADDHEPRVSVRDLPPDVQLGFWRVRVIIMVIVGVVFGVLTRSWEIALTLAILAGIVDTVRRSRNAASYANGAHPGARNATRKQLGRMRRDGYFALVDRPIPNSREVIDHLVVGPTGVYAIDSEKWNPRLPVRTLNGKRLYLGPESQKDRLDHAVWEAGQASEILSAALGTEIAVKPALAIYGPKIPWDVATIRNVDVFTGPALRKYLKRRGRQKEDVVHLTREEIRTIYDTAARMLPDVTASTITTAPVG
jgi:hypothetical protein